MESKFAIILAAGKGLRMGTDIPKQFLISNGKPVLYYTIKAFEESIVDGIIVVTSEDYIDYVKEDIVKKYNFKKVCGVYTGGQMRYDSVYKGLCACKECDYVAIHDGARPFVTQEIIARSFEDAKKHMASVAAVKSKDTIRIVDKNGFSSLTPDREFVYNIQTPQTFEYNTLANAFENFKKNPDESITDDGMIVERYGKVKVHIFEGAYSNVKITTKEDLKLLDILEG